MSDETVAKFPQLWTDPDGDVWILIAPGLSHYLRNGKEVLAELEADPSLLDGTAVARHHGAKALRALMQEDGVEPYVMAWLKIRADELEAKSFFEGGVDYRHDLVLGCAPTCPCGHGPDELEAGRE